MEARELRIGNLLQQMDGMICDVKNATFRGIEINSLDLKPIPLTEEWLVKFGFEISKIKHVKTLVLSSIGMSYCQGCISIGGCSVETKHVHQLQNLYFALTGEELTIKG